MWCLCFLLSVSRKPGISKFTGNIINLGIDTTPSRKLLTSKPDTKIGQTIVINSGRRSTRLRKTWDAQNYVLRLWFLWLELQVAKTAREQFLHVELPDTSLRRNLLVFLRARLPAQSYQREIGSPLSLIRRICTRTLSRHGLTSWHHIWRDVCC